jgi:hypothetical protein
MNPLFYVVYAFHVIISLFILFGSLLFPKRFLIYLIIVLIMFFLSWFLTDGKCGFSILEDKLSGQPSTYTYNNKTPFFTHLGLFLGFHIEEKHSIAITDSLLYIAFAVSCIRLFILNK